MTATFTPDPPTTGATFTPAGPSFTPTNPLSPDALIEKHSKQYGVDTAFARQIAGVETGGTPSPDTATSKAGARGRFQLMPETFKEMGVGDNIVDPEQNVSAGTKYLSQQLKKYGGNHVLAAAAYNAGPGAVDAYLTHGTPLPAETMAYAAHFGALPPPHHDTSEADFRNRSAGGATFTPAVPAHPSPVAVLPVQKTASGATFTPLSLSGQITDRSHTTEDPFAKRINAQYPQTHAQATTALQAAGDLLTAGTPAGGIVGGAIQDAVDAIKTGPLALPAGLKERGSTRAWDAIVKTLTGHAGDANKAYGLMETPSATALGYGGTGGAIQKGDRAMQAAVRAILPPPNKLIPDTLPIAQLRKYANDPTVPQMDESVIRGIGEFAGTLGKVPGNQLPGALVRAAGDVAHAVPQHLQQETAAVRQFSPKVADVLKRAGDEIKGGAQHVGSVIDEATNPYHALLQDVHPADAEKARAYGRQFVQAPQAGKATALRLVKKAADGVESDDQWNRIVDAYQARAYQNIVNGATDEERAAAIALRQAHGQAQAAGAEVKPRIREAGSTTVQQNVAGRPTSVDQPTALVTQSLAGSGVDPKRALEVADAMEHAERMPASLTADEVRRAKILAQNEAMTRQSLLKHKGLLEPEEAKPGYYPLRGAYRWPEEVPGAPPSPAMGAQAVSTAYRNPARYRTLAEARQYAPQELGAAPYTERSSLQGYLLDMQRKWENVYRQDAYEKLGKLRGRAPNSTLRMSPVYQDVTTMNPLTMQPQVADRATAIKNREKALDEQAKREGLADVLGPEAAHEALATGTVPGRRPTVATQGHLTAIQRAANAADALAAQTGRDTERAQATNAVGQQRVENAATDIADVRAPTERISAAVEPQIDRRLGQMQTESAKRLMAAGNAYAKAVEDFGAESPQAQTLWAPYSKAAEVDAKVQTRVDAAKAQLGESLNRGLGAVDQSVAGQAGRAAAGVSRAAQTGAGQIDKATLTTLKRVQRNTAKFTDRYKSAVLARDLAAMKRSEIDAIEKATEFRRKQIPHSGDDLIMHVPGYTKLSALATGIKDEEDTQVVDGFRKFLEQKRLPPDVASPVAENLNFLNRLARSSLVFNPVIHTVDNQGSIYLALTGDARGPLLASHSLIMSKKDFDEFMGAHVFSDEPGDTMRKWDTLSQKNGAWHEAAYGSGPMGTEGSLVRGEHGEITGYNTPSASKGNDFAQLATRPLSSLTPKQKLERIGYEMQRWNSNVVFNRGERVYAAMLMRHFMTKEGVTDPAKAANMVRDALGTDMMTEGERKIGQFAYFYNWGKTVSRLSLSLGLAKPQTWNAPLEGTRVQREGVGAEGVRMSSSNPYTIARPDAEQGGYDYYGAPIFNRILEPMARTIRPPENPQAGLLSAERAGPMTDWALSHLTPLPQLGFRAAQEVLSEGKGPPYMNLTDPQASPYEQAVQMGEGAAGQVFYPLKAGAGIVGEPGKIGPALLGGSSGHRNGKTIGELEASQQGYDVYELKKQQKAAWNRGDQQEAARLQRDIDFQEGR